MTEQITQQTNKANMLFRQRGCNMCNNVKVYRSTCNWRETVSPCFAEYLSILQESKETLNFDWMEEYVGKKQTYFRKYDAAKGVFQMCASNYLYDNLWLIRNEWMEDLNLGFLAGQFILSKPETYILIRGLDGVKEKLGVAATVSKEELEICMRNRKDVNLHDLKEFMKYPANSTLVKVNDPFLVAHNDSIVLIERLELWLKDVLYEKLPKIDFWKEFPNTWIEAFKKIDENKLEITCFELDYVNDETIITDAWEYCLLCNRCNTIDQAQWRELYYALKFKENK